jgi:phage tail-like protein
MMPESDQITQQLVAQAHVAFRYLVEIDETRMGAFTECTLPTIEWELEEVKEGGLNTLVHQLPGRRKAARLTLKHGVARGQLIDWYIQTLSEKFTPKKITVTLLDGASKPVAAWIMHDAIPVKWVGPQLRSDANTIAIQTLEFAGGQVDFEVGA